MSSQRDDSEYTSSATKSPAREGGHVENLEFEKHHSGHQTDHVGNTYDSSNLLSTSEYSTDSYDSFFQDALNAFNTDMENYYNILGKMEQKEASVQNEIIYKTEEMKNLSRVLRDKRDGALEAMGQLTAASGFKRSKP